MAKFENLTLSYTQIASIPFKTRKAASGSLLDALSRELTPGQRVALFPSYVNKIYASGGSAKERKDVPTPTDMGGEVGKQFPPASVEPAGQPRPQRTVTPKPDIIPAGLIPGPDGKPMRVPDQRIASSNIKTGDRFKDVIKNYKSRMMKDLGITDFQADGVLGNLAQESDRFRAYNEYGGGPGIGWAQWTTKERKEAFLSFANENSLDPKSDEASYLYLVHEIQNRPDLLPGGAKTLDRLRETTNAEEAARSFMDDFERPGIPHFDTRLQYTNEIAEIPYSDIDETERLPNVYDEQDTTTAEPIGTNPSGAESLIPLGAENDAVINPESRVEQVQAEVAETRKGELDHDLENLLALTAQLASEKTGRNLRIRVTSGGQRMPGAPGSVGTHEHDLGGAADFNLIETLPDGTERVLNSSIPSDDLVINDAVEIFGRSGGRSVGTEYMDDPTKIHFGISRNNPKAYLGPKEMRTSFDRGRADYLKKVEEEGLDERTGYKDLFAQEKTRREAIYQQKNPLPPTITSESAVPVATSPEGPLSPADTVPQPAGSINPDKDQTRLKTSILPDPILSSEPVDTPRQETLSSEPVEPKPTYTMGELTGKGYKAAAGGAEITDPSMIISEDGKKVTRVAETGPEKISVMPRHKSSDVFQENQSLMQEARQEQSREEAAKPDIATVKSSPQMSDFGRSRETGQSIAISTVMPRVTPSANKAFADAKMVGRFNKAGIDGDMGIVYIDRGYA